MFQGRKREGGWGRIMAKGRAMGQENTKASSDFWSTFFLKKRNILRRFNLNQSIWTKTTQCKRWKYTTSLRA